MNNAVIAGYVRSPFHFAHKGALVEKRPDDLAAEVVQGLIDQTGVDPAEIEDLIIGCAFPEGEQGFNLGRIVALIAELPISVAGATVNRFCGSSMQGDPYCCRRDPHGCRRGVHLRRRRVHESCAYGRLQSGAQPRSL